MDVEDLQPLRVLKMKNISSAELADKMDVDCVSVLTGDARRLCQMDNHVDVYHAPISEPGYRVFPQFISREYMGGALKTVQQTW